MDVLPAPPPYNLSHRLGQARSNRDETLPRYTRRNTIAQPLVRREPTAHLFQLVDGRRPWAILRLNSSAKSTKCIPTFYEQEKITGTLEIDVEKGDSSIRMINIEITGRIVTSARVEDIHKFLSLTHPVWSKDASGSKLTGKNSWPLSIALPRTISQAGGMIPLPETFREMGLDASIQYELVVHVSRTKLRTDDRIRASFAYVPSSRPGAPSELRQLATEQNVPAPGPHIDPQGWSIPRIAIARGLLYQTRPAEIKCDLTLSNPLSYTRGSFIPCFLKLSSLDSQALDCVSNPNSVKLVLKRTVKYHIASTFGKTAVSWKEYTKDIGHASWSKSRTLRSDSHSTYFDGVIKLPKDLRPSCNLSHFMVSYSVELYPFQLSAFQTYGDEGPLLSEPVDIVTMYARGHRTPSPPAYDTHPRCANDF